MAGISSLGVGSGIDLNNILAQMMEAKRQPLYDLQSQQRSIKNQITDYGALKSSMSSFKDALDKLTKSSAFDAYKASSSDEKILGVSADSKASVGSFDVTVTQLATSHKLASRQFVNSLDKPGAGTLSIEINGKTMNLTLDADDTLANLRDAINKHSDNPGVSATIINEPGGSRLMLTSKETGTENAMTFGGDLADIFDTGNGAALVSAAQNAEFKIDSFEMTSGSNSVKNVIDGVTLDLKDLGTSKVSLTRDDEAVVKLVQSMVDTYNSMNTKIAALKSTSLKTDSSLNSIRSAFQMELSKPAQLDGLKNLFEIGISSDRNGKLNLDTTKFKKALDENSGQVADLLGNETSGFATRLSSLAKNMMGNEGIFKSREKGLNDRLKFLQDSESRMQLRLDDAQARMKKQFSNLDMTMAKLNSTSSFLSSQLMSMRF